MAHQPPILPGLTILSELGEGGMSVVWKALDRRTEDVVAVKVLKPEFAANAEDARNFAAESKILETLGHPGIVKSYGLDAFDGKIYYAMEYVDGYTFGEYVTQRRVMGEEDCLLVCESIASALDYAWNGFGIVHCDLKPDNIMINTSGVVKLTDMGLSRTFRNFGDGGCEPPDHIMGTPAYISPEQVYGDVALDCRADIYSLAATLYHLCTRHILFPNLDAESTMKAHCDEAASAPDPRTYRPLSEGFCQMLEAMLVKNRDFRVPTWRDVAAMCVEVEKGVVFAPRETEAPSSLHLDTAPAGGGDVGGNA